MSTTTMHHDEEPAPRRIDLTLWARVLPFARPYKPAFAALAGIAVVIAALEVALPILTGRVIDEAAYRGEAARLWPLGWTYAGLVTVFSIFVCSFILIAGFIATRVGHDIREAAFARLQTLDPSYFDRRPVGWLMARLTSDCNSLARVMGWALLDIVWGSMMLLGITAAMLWLNWRLGLAVLAIVPPLVLAARYFQSRLLRSQRAIRKANSHVTASFNESIAGVRTTKAFGREARHLDEFRGLSSAMYDHSVRNALYAATFLPVVITICAAGVGVALWYGGYEVVRGQISLGTLVIFISFAGQFSHPIQEMARTITLMQGAQASAERIAQLLATEPTIRDSETVRARLAAHAGGNGRDGGDGGVADAAKPVGADVAEDGGAATIRRIRFDHVSFAYEKDEPVLRDFSLDVEAGQTIALVGPTGGGKSTIIGLLCRFYEPTGGRILLDGVDYRDRSLHWYQSQLGMVLQTPHLFNESVRENIRYGRLDATDDEVEQAAALVHADGFIRDLPEGYAAVVGPGGDKLSTGQKQLLSLARAVLADPQVFVMDEATSSVDTETERLIQDAIERVLRDRIAFVIAHRLSTIRRADHILVIDGGRVVEAGTHEALLAAGGRYHELYTHQHAAATAAELLGTAAPSA